MPYRRGELTAKRKMRDWPHHVRIEIPEPTGLGTRLIEMHDFVRGLDHHLQITDTAVAKVNPWELAMGCAS